MPSANYARTIALDLIVQSDKNGEKRISIHAGMFIDLLLFKPLDCQYDRITN